jgi:hypothetical protein
MDHLTFFKRLVEAEKTADALSAFAEFTKAVGPDIFEKAVGGRPNNQGTIEVATDAGRSAIERITNAIDALLELEHSTHNGKPTCHSPREAAEAWLGIDRRGLGSLSPRARQQLARRTVVQLEAGEGKTSRILTVRDSGIGVSAEEMPRTILSLNEGNKWQKHYLAGTYGQGGSSTFAFSKLTLIASRKVGSQQITFTVVRYRDLPADIYKSGHYVYLTERNNLLRIAANDTVLLHPHGTIVRHFGYDLTNYPSPFGERSLYGAMNRMMFDPVAPIWFENKVDGWNRGIYGSRTRLNSSSDDADGGKALELAHHMPMFSVSLGEIGLLGIEYWVLLPAEKVGIPIAAYVDHKKPIILSINGQNQSEISVLLIRKDAELPYLKSRLICHVNCDNLTAEAKRALFASTREQAKEGYILDRIKDEIAVALKSDDELIRLNREAKDKSLSEHDEETKRRLRKEVANMLRLIGKTQVESSKTTSLGAGVAGGGGGKRTRKLEPLETREPPTFVEILKDEPPIRFHAGQRRWLRIETDAKSNYHNAMNPNLSRINFIVDDNLKVVGTSNLRGGRMRVAIECNKETAVGASGVIRVELSRQGLPSLVDEAEYCVVQAPRPREGKRTTTFPDFQIEKVDGPEDARWPNISEDDTDATRHASRATLDEGTLYIYYSGKFPKFEEEFNRWAAQDTSRAKSFEKRYEVWLAVHSLLMHDQEQSGTNSEADEDMADEFARRERCRLAVMAAMFASHEVRSGEGAADDSDT